MPEEVTLASHGNLMQCRKRRHYAHEAHTLPPPLPPASEFWSAKFCPAHVGANAAASVAVAPLKEKEHHLTVTVSLLAAWASTLWRCSEHEIHGLSWLASTV